MRATLSVLGLLALGASAAAAEVEVRPSAPVAEFSIPDDWKVTSIERGLQAVSSDGEVYFWIEAYQPDAFKAILAEHDAYWKDQGVNISSRDASSHKEGGKEVTMTTEHATWKGAPTVLHYVEFALGLPSKTNIVLTYWASPAGDKTFHREVGEVLDSLEVTEK